MHDCVNVDMHDKGNYTFVYDSLYMEFMRVADCLWSPKKWLKQLACLLSDFKIDKAQYAFILPTMLYPDSHINQQGITVLESDK